MRTEEQETAFLPPVRWRPLLLAGTALGLFAGSLSVAFTAINGKLLWSGQDAPPFFLPRVLLLNLVYWWMWAALAPLVLRLASRFRFARERWGAALTAHLAFGLALSLVHIAVVGIARHWLYASIENVSTLEHMRSAFFRILDWDLVAYFGIVGFGHAVDYYRQAEVRARRAAQVQAELVEAQLLSLQRQLQPHLLFNTLHDISVLMQRDVDAARRMLFRLSDLLRHTLENLGVHETSLREELDFLKGYADIEAARFPDRFAVEFDTPEGTLGAAVPTMLLQPLVENAIKHGVDHRSGEPGLIRVSARAENGSLVLEVRDHGPGLAGPAEPDRPRLGIGLANTRARLEYLYPAEHRLELTEAPDGGARVTVRIPLRSVADLPHARASPDRPAP